MQRHWTKRSKPKLKIHSVEAYRLIGLLAVKFSVGCDRVVYRDRVVYHSYNDAVMMDDVDK